MSVRWAAFLGGILVGLVVDPLLFAWHFLRAPKHN